MQLFLDFWKLSNISRNSAKIPWKFQRKITDLNKIHQKFAKILKIHNFLTKNSKKSANFQFGAVQKYENLVDLEKSFKMSVWLQKSALIQPRTSPPKFDDR